MIKIFPFIFILLWSSAFITTKPIIDNSDPFAALAFKIMTDPHVGKLTYFRVYSGVLEKGGTVLAGGLADDAEGFGRGDVICCAGRHCGHTLAGGSALLRPCG